MYSRTFLLVSLLLGASRLVQSASLTEVLASKPQYSSFSQLVNNDSDISALLTSSPAKTILVPDNTAMNDSNVFSMSIPQRQAFVQYHVLNGTYKSNDLNVFGGKTTPTYLQSHQYVLLTGNPNVVFASKYGSNGVGNETSQVLVYSGIGTASKIVDPNLQFDQGVIHGVDTTLSLPETCSQTLKAESLTSLLNGLNRANLTNYVDSTPKVTCFAPQNEAFSLAGNPDANLPPDQLTKAIQRHTLQGSFIGYTDLFQDGGEYETLAGDKILVQKKDGNVLVNGVKILQANVITWNGVAHVLEGLLPPNNSTLSSGTGTPKSTAGRLSGDLQMVVGLVFGVAAWGLL